MSHTHDIYNISMFICSFNMFNWIGFKGSKSNEMVEESMNQIRYWEGTNDEYQHQQQQISSFHHHYPQQQHYLMSMQQQQNNHNFNSFSNSLASSTPHNNTENSGKVLIDDTHEAVETPQFFDFLGVGAT